MTATWQAAQRAGSIRLDPRTKLFLLLVLNFIMIGTNPVGGEVLAKCALAAIPLALLLFEGKWRQGLVYAILFAAGQYAETFLFVYAAGWWGILLRVAAQTINRLMPCFIMGYYFISSTQVSAFVAAMERMRVSRKIVIPLAVVFRFFPTISEEAGAISRPCACAASG